jgi:ERCC4-type nuclease
MERLEIERVLESFRIIADTREHNTAQAKKRFQRFKTKVERATLSYGDYCWNADLNGRPIHDTSSTISAPCVIERKMSLDELAGNFTRGRKRFQREFERAAAKNARVYLLVENATWEKIFRHDYRSMYHHNAYIASITAWMSRYNITPVFCRAETSGKMIREILYRDLKERLERGDYG